MIGDVRSFLVRSWSSELVAELVAVPVKGQVIHTRTLLPPRSLRVLIRFSAAALRQVSAIFSEPDRFPSE